MLDGKKQVSPRSIMNLDLKKAYDTVRWDFTKIFTIDYGFLAQIVSKDII